MDQKKKTVVNYPRNFRRWFLKWCIHHHNTLHQVIHFSLAKNTICGVCVWERDTLVAFFFVFLLIYKIHKCQFYFLVFSSCLKLPQSVQWGIYCQIIMSIRCLYFSVNCSFSLISWLCSKIPSVTLTTSIWIQLLYPFWAFFFFHEMACDAVCLCGCCTFYTPNMRRTSNIQYEVENTTQCGVCPAEGVFSPSPLWTGKIWFHLGCIPLLWRGTHLVLARNLTFKWKINVTVTLHRVWLFFTQRGNMKQDVRILLLGERK